LRTGFDVLKLIALSADVVLLGKLIARINQTRGAYIINMCLNYIKGDLRLAMVITSCDSLEELTMDILVIYIMNNWLF